MTHSRCAAFSPSPIRGRFFSNISEFTPTILGHHNAIKLERFRGPDGVSFTPAQLKEHFDRLNKADSLPSQNNSLHFVVNTRPPDAYLALRTQPNSRQGSRIKIMPNGTLLQVLQRQNDRWWYVRVVPSGEEGWTLSGQSNRQWIECCGTFDPKEDSVAITLEELIQKFDRHKNVLSEIETERRKFTSGSRCRSFEYWIKQSSDTSEITINCRFSSGGETGESSVTMIFAIDASGRMSLKKRDYAG